MTWKPLSTPWKVSSGSSQGRKPPTKILIVISEKKKKENTQIDFWGKKSLAKKYLGINSRTEKNIYLMVYNADKNMLHNYMSGEKILPPQVCGKKVLPNPNQIPFNPLSQMVGALGAQSLISSRSSGERSPQLESESGRNQGWGKLSLMSLING